MTDSTQKLTQDEIAEVLRLHAMWLNDATKGERANLHGVDLRGVDLSGVDLSGADLKWAHA